METGKNDSQEHEHEYLVSFFISKFIFFTMNSITKVTHSDYLNRILRVIEWLGTLYECEQNTIQFFY